MSIYSIKSWGAKLGLIALQNIILKTSMVETHVHTKELNLLIFTTLFSLISPTLTFSKFNFFSYCWLQHFNLFGNMVHPTLEIYFSFLQCLGKFSMSLQSMVKIYLFYIVTSSNINHHFITVF